MQASKSISVQEWKAVFHTHSEAVPGPLHPPLEVPDAATQQDVLALDRSLEKKSIKAHYNHFCSLY